MRKRSLQEFLDTTPAEIDIEVLRDAFGSALDALQDQHARAEERVRRKWGLAPDARPPVFFDTETGENVEWPVQDEIENLKHYLAAAMEELRIAAIVAVFHAFERINNQFRGTEDYKHKPAMAKLREMGREPDDEALRVLHLFANAAKHGKGRSMTALESVRPDLAHRHQVVATPATLDYFFDAVLASLHKRQRVRDSP